MDISHALQGKSGGFGRYIQGGQQVKLPRQVKLAGLLRKSNQIQGRLNVPVCQGPKKSFLNLYILIIARSIVVNVLSWPLYFYQKSGPERLLEGLQVGKSNQAGEDLKSSQGPGRQVKSSRPSTLLDLTC